MPMRIRVARANGSRVVRGGSWNDQARNVRAAYRNWNHPENRNDNLGFRCAQLRRRRLRRPNRPASAAWLRPCQNQRTVGALVAWAAPEANARRRPALMGEPA